MVIMVNRTCKNNTENCISQHQEHPPCVDHPHATSEYYHINTDLKMLQNLNHKNIEPIVDMVADATAKVKQIGRGALNIATSIASGETFLPFILFSPTMLQDFGRKEIS